MTSGEWRESLAHFTHYATEVECEYIQYDLKGNKRHLGRAKAEDALVEVKSPTQVSGWKMDQII